MGARARFQAIDTANEGVISRAALRTALALAPHGLAAPQADGIFAAIDSDGDGEISLDQWMSGFKQFEALVAAHARGGAVEVSDGGFAKPGGGGMDADPPLRAALRHLGLDTNGGATMDEMRAAFHALVGRLGPLPPPGSPQETSGEYGKLSGAYSLLVERALCPALAARPAPTPADDWSRLQAALEAIGWRTERCPLLRDGSGHGRRFLTTIYHGGLELASVSGRALPAVHFDAAQRQAQVALTQEGVQGMLLSQLAKAVCRGLPLVIDLRPCP